MPRIQEWIEKQLAAGVTKKDVKKQLEEEGYSESVISFLDEVESPYERSLEKKSERRKTTEILAAVIVVAALAAGAYYAYSAYYATTEEGIMLNLSKVYGNVTAMRVTDSSMEPALSEGKTIYVANGYYRENSAAKGDVVVVSLGRNGASIRRVAAAGAERVSKDEPYLEGTLLLKQLEYYRYVVPVNRVIVLGDNPAESIDSRRYGILPVSHLAGRGVT